MEIQNINVIKRTAGRPKINILDSIHDRKLYAKNKNKEIVFCDVCNCHVSYYALSQHKKCKKHHRNLVNIEIQQ
jgi:hypothetical protein